MQFNYSLLNNEDTYVVGVSGGCDSMALLDVLHQGEYKIVVCHVNYHLRHDSNVDEQTVNEYCKLHDIPCYIKNVNRDEYDEGNFQSLARKIRYEFYLEVANKYNTNKVVLAHHKDDVIETIVMQKQRHSDKGYLGIKDTARVFSMIVIRPFLECNKSQLQEYCQRYDIVYHDDYTNFQTDFFRDYVRNITLKDYTLKQKEELLKEADKHNEEYLNKLDQVQVYLDKYTENDIIDYHLIPSDLLEIFLYEILKKDIYPPLISDNLIQEIIKQINSDKPNIQMDLPVNYQFIKEYDNIRVSISRDSKEYCLKYDHLVYDKNMHFILSDEGHLNEGVFVEEQDFPITIRTYLPGDSIITKSGTKKVSRLFIDNKIPEALRKTWPIVVNGENKIILVPHLAKNIDYLTTKPNLYVLKL